MAEKVGWVDVPVEIVRAFEAGIRFANSKMVVWLPNPGKAAWTEDEWRAALKAVMDDIERLKQRGTNESPATTTSK